MILSPAMVFHAFVGTAEHRTDNECEQFIEQDPRLLLEKMDKHVCSTCQEYSRFYLHYVLVNDTMRTTEFVSNTKHNLSNAAMRMLSIVSTMSPRSKKAASMRKSGANIAHIYRQAVAIEHRTPFTPILTHNVEILMAENLKEFRDQAEELLLNMGLLQPQID